jgi:hypothetical protein
MQSLTPSPHQQLQQQQQQQQQQEQLQEEGSIGWLGFAKDSDSSPHDIQVSSITNTSGTKVRLHSFSNPLKNKWII